MTVYHHGNLRQSLLDNSLQLLRAEGSEALSLRRLAELTGVSRAAPYHHFKDKQALLAAVAAQGFAELAALLQQLVSDEQIALEQRLQQAVLGYLDFAQAQPALYQLMFGQTLWPADSPAHGNSVSTTQFQRAAKDCFRQYVHLFERLQAAGQLASSNALRSAQLLWATLHGLATLTRDGAFFTRDDLAEIAAHALAQFARAPA
ncbi:MAG: TetR/AcrR family transcriptional regulator [Pseudomonas sp.]|uniref:TetR/AcrR family transcriptional regulator n=1 Tax=Pseudomonas sp. TaxID=306 RepID=UPI003BB5AAA7